MLFSSTFFLLYFLPVFLTIYFVLPNTVKNYYIVFASILFYAWGSPLFVFALSGAVLIDFTLAHLIHKNEGKKRKIYLFIGVMFNVSVLLYFKYFNFFMDNFNEVLEDTGLRTFSFLRVGLPIGISFFVFHELSYIIDVYRRVKPPMKNIVNYALYIFLFPQLIAGPIIRFNEIADQIVDRKYQDNIDSRIIGFFRFAIGLGKKVLIANVLGAEADRIFALPIDQLDFVLSWAGALTYTFQIYFDFSGYSDMAIGIAKMMGFTFPENFNNPYIAQSITDFWKRWHMSLSRWMRDYLYIPLGGNKVSGTRLYFNLWVVFLISGFWHGAQWTFIIWGAYHGFFLAIERLFLLKLMKKTGTFFRILFTFFVTIISWIIFRSATPQQAFMFYKKMFSFSWHEYTMSNHLIVVLVIAVILSFIAVFNTRFKSDNPYYFPSLSWKRTAFSVCVILVLMILCIGDITSSNFNPFIYFQF